MHALFEIHLCRYGIQLAAPFSSLLRLKILKPIRCAVHEQHIFTIRHTTFFDNARRLMYNINIVYAVYVLCLHIHSRNHTIGHWTHSLHDLFK